MNKREMGKVLVKPTLEEISDILAKRDKVAIHKPGLTPAGVLLLLFDKEGEYHLIFNRRTLMVEHHKGEISFPGGAKDDEDKTLLDSARRETYEEMGIRREDVRILGELDDQLTHSSGFCITPFVGALPYPYPYQVNPVEIDEVLETPLSFFLNEGNCKEEQIIWEGMPRTVYHYDYNGNVIYGVTAFITRQFLNLVFGH